MPTQQYEQILKDIESEMTPLQALVVDLLKRHPKGRTRRELVRGVYGKRVENIANSSEDRKIRLAIVELRKKCVPIVASSGKAGYRLDPSKEGAEQLAAWYESFAKKGLAMSRVIRKRWGLRDTQMGLGLE